MHRSLLALLVLATGALAACGSTTKTTITTQTVVRTVVDETAQSIAESNAAIAAAEARAAKRSARAASRSASRAAGSRPATPGTPFVNCDQNIRARRPTTSCGFALNVFYEFWASGQASYVTAYSKAAARSFTAHCRGYGGYATVSCTTTDGAEIRFPRSAADSYSRSAARAYARTHDVTPVASAASSTSAVDPGTYSDDDYEPPTLGSSPGSYSPPTTENYGNGNGYTVRCSDGTLSDSGGVQGACSHHGGVG